MALHKWLVLDRLKLLESKIEAEFQLYVTDDPQDPYWQAINKENLSIQLQQGNSLGERMSQVSSLSDQYSWTVLIGADCPDLDAAYIQLAIDSLGEGKEIVLGPAEDGGYVLLGFKEHIPALFESIDWGTDRVLAQTLSVLDNIEVEKISQAGFDQNQEKLFYSLLKPKRDLDLLEDLQYYCSIYSDLKTLLFA